VDRRCKCNSTTRFLDKLLRYPEPFLCDELHSCMQVFGSRSRSLLDPCLFAEMQDSDPDFETGSESMFSKKLKF